ncbi:MAG: choice-of-anchor Q domain-containing protein, partial [Planctomycetota bacterium]
LEINNSTLSGNVAQTGGAVRSGRLQINGTTITNNASSYEGGGLRVNRLTSVNSIIAGNRVVDESNGPDVFYLSPNYSNITHTLIGNNSGTDLPASDQPDENGNLIGSALTPIDPRLSRLQDNGGPTLTHVFLSGSPAINRGDNDSAFSTTDQRGFSRIIDGTVDLGATEAAPIANADFNGDEVYDCHDIDELVVAIASAQSDSRLDLNNDGALTTDDVNLWLEFAARGNRLDSTYRPGDYNLDGAVDVGDFNAWNQNKFSFAQGWCAGDGNADGAVDTSDFNIWNEHKFTSSSAGSTNTQSLNSVAFKRTDFSTDDNERLDGREAIDAVFANSGQAAGTL